MVDETDANQNGYPDVFEQEEQEMVERMRQRRAAYMNRYKNAEQSFVSSRKKPNLMGDVYSSPDEQNRLFDGELID